jgi:site-specific recombinase XerD
MEVAAFHSTPDQYREYQKKSIKSALSDGRLAEEDISYVREFIEEVAATGNLSQQRRFKITSNLMNSIHHLPPAREMCLADVYAAIDALKCARKSDGTEYSVNTKADYIRIVKRYVLWLIENEHVRIDGAKVKKIRVPAYTPKVKSESDILTEEEVKRIIETPRSIRYRALLGILYEGGFRIQEMAYLRWSDVLFFEWGCRIRTDGKTEKERNVPIIAYREHLAQWRTEHPNPAPENFVFLNNHNRPLKYQSIEKVIKGFCKSAGIEKHVTPHILRHSRVTHVLRAGMQETIAKKTFWGNVNTDMIGVYGHLTSDDARDEFARLAGIEIPEKEKAVSELQPVQCPSCHKVMPPGSGFCARCGMTLTAAAAESLNTVIKAAEAVIANPNDPEALTILLEARTRMARGE